MSLLNAVSVDVICARGTIVDTDVLALRRAFYEDGSIDAAEAEVVFRLNDTCAVQDPGWADCFVEMLTDHIVNHAKPEGYLTIENATWLIERIGRDGQVDSKTELELLINVLDKARWSPESLVSFALQQVKRAVISGDGPLRAGKSLSAGEINEAEVELLKRVLYAFGGDGNIAISRSEAEILFEIEAATAGRNNAESWPDLFVKAIANCVMTASGYAPPSREQALARETWLERRGDLSLGAIVGAAARSGVAGMLAAYREQSPVERAIAALERQKIEIVTAEEVTVAEANWLADQIGRDGKLSANEQALLEFLSANSPNIAPELAERISVLRRAA